MSYTQKNYNTGKRNGNAVHTKRIYTYRLNKQTVIVFTADDGKVFKVYLDKEDREKLKKEL